MKHSIPHDLTPDLAKQATEKAFQSYQARFPEYAPTFKWISGERADISFKIKGVGLSGLVAVLGSRIDMDLDVPFVFKVFQKKAVQIIDGEVRSWIGKAKSGQL